MKKSSLFSLVLLFMALQNVHATNSCESIFGSNNIKKSSAFVSASKRNQLMRKYGYVIEGNVLSKNRLNKKIKLGQIVTLQPDYFFEWKTPELHKKWVQSGRYTDMDYALNEKGRYGSGFYVSLNPSDSSAYGTHLTIFKISRKVDFLKGIGLSEKDKQKFDLTDVEENIDRETIDELREMGFAGFTSDGTWLSVINEKLLESVRSVDKEIYSYLKENFPFELMDISYKDSILDFLYPDLHEIPDQEMKMILQLNPDWLVKKQTQDP